MKKKHWLLALALAVCGPLALATPASGDCVECKSDQTCGDPVYQDWDHCVIENVGGQFWCNHVGECTPDEEEDLLLAMTAAGRYDGLDPILSPDGRAFVSGCGEFIVRTLAGESSNTTDIVI